MDNRQLAGIFSRLGLDAWGICAYEAALPLIPCRAALRIPEQARSVLVCLFPYYTGPLPAGNLSRYAALDDYHTVAGGILDAAAAELSALFPGDEFVPFVDNSPIREVSAASLAGLGQVGQNGLLLHPRYGSYLFIGSIVTTGELASTGASPKHCVGCGRCIAACPTGALGPDGVFHKERCRSHITQKKGMLSPWEEAQIRDGGLVWGCDRCLDACPANNLVEPTPIQAFYNNIQPCFSPGQLDALMQSKAYAYRGRQVLLRNYQLISGGSAADQE